VECLVRLSSAVAVQLGQGLGHAAPDNGTRRPHRRAGRGLVLEQDDQLGSRTCRAAPARKQPLDRGARLSPYLGHKRCDQPGPEPDPEIGIGIAASSSGTSHSGISSFRWPPTTAARSGCRSAASPVFDAGGAFRGYLGAGRDITSQKRAQQLLMLENAVMSCLAGAGGVTFALKVHCARYAKARAGIALSCGRWTKRAARCAFTSIGASRTSRHRGPGRGCEPDQAGEGMVGSVWQSGKPLWIGDYLQQAAGERVGDELFEKMGLRAALLVPLRAGPEIVGVLRFGSRAIRAPDERLSDRLSALRRPHRQVRAAGGGGAGQQRARRALASPRGLVLRLVLGNGCQPLLYPPRRPLRRGRRPDLQRRLIGLRRWESGLEIEEDGTRIARCLTPAGLSTTRSCGARRRRGLFATSASAASRCSVPTAAFSAITASAAT